jgi:hypothetical protein
VVRRRGRHGARGWRKDGFLDWDVPDWGGRRRGGGLRKEGVTCLCMILAVGLVFGFTYDCFGFGLDGRFGFDVTFKRMLGIDV